ncbi:MAG: phage head closure protein [Magnetococcales bacterium]|nr:phage head closure protein [Magnetococcales bacterium]
MTIMLRAGELRHRIAIQSRVSTRDASGEESVAWTTIVSCWANLDQLVGTKIANLGVSVAKVDAKITIRYNPLVTPTMRVLADGDTYEINSVIDPTGVKMEMNLLCTKKSVGDG